MYCKGKASRGATSVSMRPVTEGYGCVAHVGAPPALRALVPALDTHTPTSNTRGWRRSAAQVSFGGPVTGGEEARATTHAHLLPRGQSAHLLWSPPEVTHQLWTTPVASDPCQ